MKITVSSRIKRTIGRLDNYFPFNGNSLHIPLAENCKNEGEEFFGIYKNSIVSETLDIVVTNKGLYLVRNGNEENYIPYNQILNINFSEPKKYASTLLITLKDSSKISLPVLGRDEETSDLFEFLRFLKRVKEDLEQN